MAVLTSRTFVLALGLFAYCTPSGQTALAQTQELGLVTSRPCPYSCVTRGLPKSMCRDWNEGDTCYVEDLTKPASGGLTGGSSVDKDPLGLDAIAPRGGADTDSHRKPRTSHGRGNATECDGLARDEIAPPRVNISRDRDSGSYRNQETVRGSVEGVCVQEAGYFEDGKKVSEIEIETNREFQRFDFEIRIRKDRYPEIRAYNSAGESFILPLYKDHDQDTRDVPSSPKSPATHSGANRF